VLALLAACGGPPEINNVQDLADALVDEGFEKCARVSDNGDGSAVCVGEGADRFYLYTSPSEGSARYTVDTLRKGASGGAIVSGDTWVVMVYDAEIGRRVSDAFEGDYVCVQGTALKSC
jgi:hypothetical protein